ncbi:MAG: phosphoribosylanthranilate isomerase [Candidatus Bathyarchaeia archaeon]|nr:phosphoribosylanthranilate isomerase [Candidatus Bathyarchaeota archaeon]
MSTVKVKICGITREEDLEAACRFGADMVGFVVEVPSSPRNLSIERAEYLFRLVPHNVKSVLVTVPSSLDQLLETYKRVKPDIIQLHGDGVKDYDLLREKLPKVFLVKALAIGYDAVTKAVDLMPFFDGFHADTHSAGKHGGTGIVHDWNLSRRLKEVVHPKPVILAGGLNPWNVRDAIRTVKPYAVDVSSGVESKPGIKDHLLMEAFIRNAKNESFKTVRRKAV